MAKKKNYRTYLYYICTDDVLINKDRVLNRISKGGHAVPQEKVEDRYYRSLDLLHQAITLSDRVFLFDNSGEEHVLIGEVATGKEIILNQEHVPNWIYTYVLSRL